MMIDKGKVEEVLGKTFVDNLDEIVIDSGNLVYSKWSMVEKLGCANFAAAARLSKILKRLDITSAPKLFRTDPASLARAKGIGATSIYVAMCILDANNYDVITWWGWRDTNEVKFSTFKHNIIRRSRRNKQEVA